MTAGSDRSLAGTAGGSCDRSLQPRPRQRPKSTARGGLWPSLAPPYPKWYQLSDAQQRRRRTQDWDTKHQSEDLVQVCTTAP